MFGVVCKKSHFSRQSVNYQFNLCLVLRVRPIGTQNQELRPLLDSLHRHESNGSLRFGKQAFIENHIFRGNPNCLDLSEF